MTILIDGYNLLHVTRFAPVGNSEDVLRRSREALLTFLSEKLTDAERQETMVVFDAPDKKFGLPDAYAFAGIELRFARTFNSADDLIEQLIQADPCPERLVVVSSDHRIHRFAKRDVPLASIAMFGSITLVDRKQSDFRARIRQRDGAHSQCVQLPNEVANFRAKNCVSWKGKPIRLVRLTPATLLNQITLSEIISPMKNVPT
ncbi:MAG: NYN domain-containing protein [Pirellulaceae bacterium]